jgi:8-oxo-dGTP pyrophosphatase MutT (NUDIX family)
MSLKRRLAGWLQRFPLLRWLLALGVRLFVPRHYVGAVGAIFNDTGQVLLLEHVFRPHFPWGLPGGWVERDESPADAVRREIEEELGLAVEIKQLLLFELQGSGSLKHTVPLSLGFVYYCRLSGESQSLLTQAQHSREILSVAWVDPAAITHKLTPLERKGVALGRQAFEQEQANTEDVVRD